MIPSPLPSLVFLFESNIRIGGGKPKSAGCMVQWTLYLPAPLAWDAHGGGLLASDGSCA